MSSSYLLSYDCVTFYRYLESLKTQEIKSPWLFMDAADQLFKVAKQRVFVEKRSSSSSTSSSTSTESKKKKLPKIQVEDLTLDDDSSVNNNNSSTTATTTTTTAAVDVLITTTTSEGVGEYKYQPILEENPKWALLAEVLAEIEKEESIGKSIF
jgi:DNA excision repair protein ERCC-4